MADPKSGHPPVKTFCAGGLNVAVFDHAGKAPDFRTWYSVSPSRSFKRDDSPDWQRTNNFNRDDLPVIAELLNCAFRWIIHEEAKVRSEIQNSK